MKKILGHGRWAIALAALLGGCSRAVSVGSPRPLPRTETRVDTLAISRVARELSADSLRGRGPWTPENTRVARRLAEEIGRAHV